LSKSFVSVEAVRGLDLRVYEGDVYGFLGRNGAGKSTTIRMILGLVRPTGGWAKVFGMDVRTHRKPVLERVGSLVEAPGFYGHLTGRENLRIFAALCGADAADVERALDEVGLSPAADRPVKGYSQGMRQRLGIARALLNDPELLVLDEPTNGLDPQGTADVRELIRTLGRRGVTVFLSSHLLGEVQQVCNRVGIVDSGRLLVEGRTGDLLHEYRSVLAVACSRTEEAGRFLAGLGWVRGCRAVDGELHVDQEREDAARTCRALVENGFDVTKLLWTESTLEDYFLQKTGGAGA